MRTVRIKLLDLITTHFNEPELRELTFRLDIEYDDLPGKERRAKALELVRFCERTGRLGELIALCLLLPVGLLLLELLQPETGDSTTTLPGGEVSHNDRTVAGHAASR